MFTTAARVLSVAALAAASLLGSYALADDAASANTEVIHQTPQGISGALIGGIGAGFLELRPDGCFYEWQLFNRGPWAYTREFWETDKFDRYPLMEMNQNSLQFFVRSKGTTGEPQVRRLGVNSDQMVVYSADAPMMNVESIDYTAAFPGATLKYNDSTIPVQVSGHFYSAVIPHDLKTSGTPGMYAVFTVKNTSKEPQEVSLAGSLRNPCALGGDPKHRGADIRKLKTSVDKDGDTTYLTLRTDAGDPFKSTLGSMCLSTAGGQASFIANEFTNYMNGVTINPPGWWDRWVGPLQGFRDTGKLPSLPPQECPNHLVPSKKEDVAKLSPDEIGQIIEQAKKIPSLAVFVDQAQVADPTLLDPNKNGRAFIDVLRVALDGYAGPNRLAQDWGDGMLADSITLQPGESKDIRFTLSWYFPNHTSPKGERNMGHAYSAWFKDAEGVNQFLNKNYEDITKRVNAFDTALLGSTMPASLIFSTNCQLYTMVGMSWWTADDRMGIWEGFGAIGMNTMDVSYEGSPAISALFPEWEKKWMAQVTEWRDPSGRLYHSLPSDLTNGGKRHDWGYVDVNSAYVMEACRDYLWNGDKDHLKQIWPGVVASMNVVASMDSNGDGLPDQHTAANWYDTFQMKGIPGLFSEVWIQMLRAGIRMGTDLGDQPHVDEWKAILAKAGPIYDKTFFNGEYFSMWVDGDVRDEACLSDQLSGEFYARMIGLGNYLPEDRVKSVAETIFKYDYSPDRGLVLGSYPPGRQPRLPVYRNVQCDANWSGFEYAYAAMMFDLGFPDQAMDVINSVYQRYDRAGRWFNHHECGDHYYRPMCIWSALITATGFKIDQPQQLLTIAPSLKQAELTAPFCIASGFGSFTRTDHKVELNCREGDVTFTTLRVDVPSVKQATLDDQPIAADVKQEGGLTVLHFPQAISVKAGQKLVISD